MGSWLPSTYADCISINHPAAHWCVALLLEVPTKEGHVLHVCPEENVERIANDGHGADCSVEEDISQHPGDQPAWRAELSGFPDEVGRRLIDPPTPDQAIIIRDAIGLRKRTELCPNDIERRRELGKRLVHARGSAGSISPLLPPAQPSEPVLE